MTVPYFGIIFDQVSDDARPPVTGDFSIFGLVLPSSDADPTTFPLNTPVLINSADTTALTALGTGPLYKAVKRIDAQLEDFNVSAQGIVVRVTTGVDDAHTMANILGDPAQGTGMYALLKAPQVCNATPRLIAFPGFTGTTNFSVTNPVILTAGSGYTNPVVTFTPPGATATAAAGNAGVRATGTATVASGGVTAIAVNNPGSLYPTAPAVTLSGGGGSGATAHATVLNGVVTGYVVDNAGSNYTSAPTVTVAAPPGGQITAINLTSPGNYAQGVTPTIAITDSNGGTGSGATASTTLEQLANPICAAAPSIAASLLAHVIVGGPGLAKQDAINWKTTLPDEQRLIPEDAWEIVQTLDGLSTEYIDGVATSIGLQIRVDNQHEGYPFWSFANQPIVDADGVKRPDAFSLTDGATDGQELLTAGVGITVRGDLSDTSLDDSGLIKVVVNNASSDTLYNLYNKNRGRDFVNLALLKSIRKRLGVENVTVQGVQAVLNDINAVMTLVASKGCVLGYTIGFNAADNTVAGIRAGKFTVYDNSEEPAPIIQVTIKRGLDADAITNEINTLASGVISFSS